MAVAAIPNAMSFAVPVVLPRSEFASFAACCATGSKDCHAAMTLLVSTMPMKTVIDDAVVSQSSHPVAELRERSLIRFWSLAGRSCIGSRRRDSHRAWDWFAVGRGSLSEGRLQSNFSERLPVRPVCRLGKENRISTNAQRLVAMNVGSAGA